MAAGDVTVIDQFLEGLGREVHQLETDDFKVGLVTSTTTPTAATANPCWGAGGSTNWSTNQVTPGGNYATGGPSIGGTYSQTSGTATFDGTDVSITQNASNPTNARWGIGYNDTTTNKEVVFFIDLGADIDLSAGDFSITWNASGIFTIA